MEETTIQFVKTAGGVETQAIFSSKFLWVKSHRSLVAALDEAQSDGLITRGEAALLTGLSERDLAKWRKELALDQIDLSRLDFQYADTVL